MASLWFLATKVKTPSKLIVLLIAAAFALVITPLSAIKIVVPDQYKDQIEAIKAAERAEREKKLNYITGSSEGSIQIFVEDKPEQPDAAETSVEDDEFIVMPVVESKIDTQETLGEGEGRVAGQVFDKESGQPLRGVAILVEGTDFGTVTDSQGRYRISNVPSATYSLSFFKPGYIEATVTDTRVMEGELMKLDFAMLPRPSDMSDEIYVLQDFTVTAEEAASQNVALLALRQTSIASIDALSSEDFSKFAAGDAAEAISKISGASLSDGKYVVFRGLNDRYNTTLINGVLLPSPDPDRKAVALDIFPTSLFDSIIARKTYTTDMPGESSGGSVEMVTKGIPDEPFLKFSVGTGGQINSSDTEKFLADPEQVSLSGWLEGDDNRGFDIVPGTDELVSKYPNMVGNSNFPLSAPLERSLPGFGDRSYSFSAGGSKEINKWLSVGAVLGLKVSEKRRSKFTETFKIGINEGKAVISEVAGRGLVDLGVLTPAQASLNGEAFGGVLKSEEEYASSVLFGFGAQISDHTSLNYSFLRAESLTSSAERVDYYKFEDSNPTVDTTLPLPDNAWYKYSDFEVGSEERLLQAHQFSGEHTFAPFGDEDWTFSWHATSTEMEQSEPDQRVIGEWLPEYGAFASDPGLPPVTRFQRETEQESTMVGFNVNKEWELSDSIKIGFEFGYDSEESDREFRQLESQIFRELEVDDPLFAAMPFPNPSEAALDQLVEDFGIETFYDAFVDETLTGGVNELVDALYARKVTTQQSQLTAAQNTLINSQNAFNGAQNDFNNAQTSLNTQIEEWEGFTGVDYETEFDPGNSFHTLAETWLVYPAQVTLADSQTALDTAQNKLDADQADLDAESARNTLIQNEQANYQAAAAALIAQIASTPALATDPTAFPDFSFFGDQDYILNTPRGFSVYADASPNISNIQFSDANGLFQAVGRSETESFYVSGNLVFEKVPLVNSLRLAGGLREESSLLSYELIDNALGEPVPASGDGGGVSPLVVQSSSIDQKDQLSFLAVIFEITDDLKLHLSRSNTVAKPTFREIAPFPIFNLSDRSFEQGNGGLTLRTANSYNQWLDRTDKFEGKSDSEVPDKFVLPVEFAGLEIAKVESRDIRLEYYTPLDGLISIGYFEKDVGAPIERIFAYSAVGTDVNTFINNDNDATLDGVEVEVQQNLGILNELFEWDVEVLDWITVGGNYTKLNAEVERSSIEKQNLTNVRAESGFDIPDLFQDGGAESTRPLYDQPAYVGNAFISFDIEKTGTRLTISQNWLGEQLDRAGGIGDPKLPGLADTYWDEFSSVNLVVEQDLTDHIKLKLSVKNLDSPVRSLYEDDIFYTALSDEDLYRQSGGSSSDVVAGSAGGFKRTSQAVEPSYSISISGSF
jgi:hypothetical protein